MARIVRYKFNPFEATGLDKPKGVNRKEALEAIADFVLESTLVSVGEQRSPVKGRGKFPKLDKEYAKFKRASGRPGVPDLEFSGKMLGELKTRVDGNFIISEITGTQGDKADGHNDHSGASELPLRRFIPKDEGYNKEVMDGVKLLIRAHQDGG